jgi:hypothetical protein
MKEESVEQKRESLEEFRKFYEKQGEMHSELLANIKEKMPELEELLTKINGHWCYEDYIYRFYHQSFKVYYLQSSTLEIIETLKKIAPQWVKERNRYNCFLEEILKEGASEKKFEMDHNKEWLEHTRPIVEAFLHAKYFLEMAIKYGKELEEAPQCLPSGWAGLLYFYNLR